MVPVLGGFVSEWIGEVRSAWSRPGGMLKWIVMDVHRPVLQRDSVVNMYSYKGHPAVSHASSFI